MTNTEFKEFKQAIISKEYLTKQEFTNVKNVGKQISETDLMQQYILHMVYKQYNSAGCLQVIFLFGSPITGFSSTSLIYCGYGLLIVCENIKYVLQHTLQFCN